MLSISRNSLLKKLKKVSFEILLYKRNEDFTWINAHFLFIILNVNQNNPFFN